MVERCEKSEEVITIHPEGNMKVNLMVVLEEKSEDNQSQ